MEIEPPHRFERLVENIRNELAASNALLELGLDLAQLNDLAERVASNIHYAFTYQFGPSYAKPGEAHRWREANSESTTGEWHFRECLACGRMTKHQTESEADSDYRSHFAQAHDA